MPKVYGLLGLIVFASDPAPAFSFETGLQVPAELRSTPALDWLGNRCLPCWQEGLDPQTRESRLSQVMRLAVYADGTVGWRRLENSCRGNSADRCSTASISLGLNSASASMQWREDGARAVVARRDFAADGLHVRLEVNYRF